MITNFSSDTKKITIESHEFAVEGLWSKGINDKKFGDLQLRYLGKK